MSILDPVQKTLSSNIWNSNKKLKSKVRDQIINVMLSFLNKNNIKAVYIIGTIAGYQYKPNSDVDVQVVVDPPELASHNKNPLVNTLKNNINGKLINGTQHPLNFFLYGWYGKSADWSDSSFGVYDVLEDVWVHPPGDPNDIKDPKLEYGIELNTAQLYLRKFERLVNNWKTHINILNTLEGDSFITLYNKNHIKEELKNDFNNLVEFCHELDRERKFEYDMKFGVPRKNWRNIVFKIIEGSKFGEFFEFFKEIKVSDSYTIFRDIVKTH